MFERVCRSIASGVGHPGALIAAFMVTALWGLSGPLFHYSDGWQLIINTGTTIVTFLMTFVIQNAQNRDTLAINLKLDELLRAVAEAKSDLRGVEDKPAAELRRLKKGAEDGHDAWVG